jgi:hypothetical protein
MLATIYVGYDSLAAEDHPVHLKHINIIAAYCAEGV